MIRNEQNATAIQVPHILLTRPGVVFIDAQSFEMNLIFHVVSIYYNLSSVNLYILSTLLCACIIVLYFMFIQIFLCTFYLYLILYAYYFYVSWFPAGYRPDQPGSSSSFWSHPDLDAQPQLCPSEPTQVGALKWVQAQGSRDTHIYLSSLVIAAFTRVNLDTDH